MPNSVVCLAPGNVLAVSEELPNTRVNLHDLSVDVGRVLSFLPSTCILACVMEVYKSNGAQSVEKMCVHRFYGVHERKIFVMTPYFHHLAMMILRLHDYPSLSTLDVLASPKVLTEDFAVNWVNQFSVIFAQDAKHRQLSVISVQEAVRLNGKDLFLTPEILAMTSTVEEYLCSCFSNVIDQLQITVPEFRNHPEYERIFQSSLFSTNEEIYAIHPHVLCIHVSNHSGTVIYVKKAFLDALLEFPFTLDSFATIQKENVMRHKFRRFVTDGIMPPPLPDRVLVYEH